MTQPQPAPIRRALLSVSDKDGVVELARVLARHGVQILSTGGTKDAIAAANIPVTDVSDVTGFPEMLSGRVKTLHPAIHGGLLGLRDDAGHREAMAAHGIDPIDLLVVNLYPFEATVARGGAFENCIEQIDIGGPALIRAAAKNHGHVTVVVDPDDYGELIGELDAQGGATGLELRRRLAAKAYARTAAYDAAIARWFSRELGESTPERLLVSGTLRQTLRYGENPHQSAAFYVTGDARPGVATARQIQGKELSYNNINDTNAAFELVAEFNAETHAAVAIIKHANPCGVALGDTLSEAYEKALRTDPVSAFGGIVAVNRPLDGAAAEKIAAIFTEVVIAPDADEEALEILKAKKNLRVLVTGGLPDPTGTAPELRQVAGGFLVQGRDGARVDRGALKVVTKRAPGEAELEDLLFAFSLAKHVKSNAIVYAKDLASMAIGAGQMSRLDSARIAARKAEDAAKTAGLDAPLTQGSVAASDAFFPFADGLETIAEAGATAVIQPGGSVRDEEVIAAADAAGLAMVFTGIRHFRH